MHFERGPDEESGFVVLIGCERVRHPPDPNERVLFWLRDNTVSDGVVSDVLEVIEKILMAADDVIPEGLLPMKMGDVIVRPAIAIESIVEIDQFVRPSQAMIYIIACGQRFRRYAIIR